MSRLSAKNPRRGNRKMRRRVVTALLVGTAALGCSSFPTSPKPFPEAGGLRLDGAISSATVPLGETAVLTFRLKNLTDEAIKLDFGSGCQVTIFIETAGGKEIYPGGYSCTQAGTTFALAPGGERLRSMEIFGGRFQQAVHTGYPIPEGRYRAYAILEPNSRGLDLRSEYVKFEVR